MPTLLPLHARIEIARSIYRDIVNSKDYWYVFAAHQDPWNPADTPPALVDTWDTILSSQRDMILVRRVRPIDVVYLTRRIDWTTGTVYDRYDSDVYLAPLNFYVLTDDFRVYKCLDNNHGAESTIKPTTTNSVDPERTSDGYVWKFMYEIPSRDRIVFLTADYIPVRFYTAGSNFDTNAFVNSVSVTHGGSGYTHAEPYIEGDGSGAVLSATITDGYISAINVIQEGYGYSYARVKILGDGTGADAVANLVAGDINEAFGYAANAQVAAEGSLDGAIFAVEIVAGGQNYVVGQTTVGIVGDGTGAEITVTSVDSTGAITGVSIPAEGSGYSFADLTVTGTTFGSGASLRAIMSPQGGHGQNAPKELCATILGVAVSLQGDSDNLLYASEYRQVGLIKNLQVHGSTELFTADSGTPCYIADVTTPSEFSVDDIVVTPEGGKFRVIYIDVTSNIWIQPIIPIISTVSTLRRDVVGAPGIVINSLTNPDVNNLSGEVVYLNNRVLVQPVSGQEEIVQVFLRF